jgi:hypothetical protein
MKEIIFDLLSVGKSTKTFTINPEVKIKKLHCSNNEAFKLEVDVLVLLGFYVALQSICLGGFGQQV